jgi:AcrR family transcriptional regulator
VTTQRGAETRRQLLEAAGRVFATRGYARATTKEIAKVAGVAEGTIYRHFADKQDLFYATFSAKSAVTADVFLCLPDLAGKETVRENLRRFITVIEDIERMIAPLQASMWSDAELMGALASSGHTDSDGSGGSVEPLLPLLQYLRAEQALGRIKEEVDCERAAFALFAIPFASVVLSRTTGGHSPSDDLDIMGGIDVILGGLLPPVG